MRLILVMLFASLSWNTEANEVRLLTFKLPGLQNEQQTGAYDLIRNQVPVNNIEFLPTKRAGNVFVEKTCVDCCISAWSIASFNQWNKKAESFKLIQSLPIGNSAVHIFSKERAYHSIKSLAGKIVALKRGNYYGNDLSDLNVVYTNTVENNILMLQKGRVDAILAYVPDVYASYQNLGLEPELKGKAIYEVEDRIVCRQSPATVSYIEAINKTLIANDLKNKVGRH